jgi:ABC-type phosphate/phosphonate transport system permease subunit
LIPLKRKRPDLSQDLNDIIMKSLSVDLEERYQSVGELEKALMYIGDYRKKMFDTISMAVTAVIAGVIFCMLMLCIYGL